MSCGSPNVTRSKIRTIQGCTIVSPQPITDTGILDSVAGFISEVATTYNNPIDNREPIQWVKFEQVDSHIHLNDANGEKIVPPALILILGYTNGMQVWAIPANGEAIDVLSWRHGTVKVLRFLPSPYKVGCDPDLDVFAKQRPLMALCDSSTPNATLHSLSFLSVKSGEQVKLIQFKNPILDVLANKRSVVVTFAEKIAIFDAFTLKNQLAITTCYVSPGINPNPVALGSRWLAYAEKKFIYKRSKGGSEGEGVQSYKATVLQAAKSISKGLMELGGTVASSLTGSATTTQSMGTNADAVDKGIVTILDIDGSITEDNISSSVVAHFTAQSEAIVSLSFDPSGLLLLTADRNGHHFHVFRIHPHPGGSALTAIHHLYTLHRGDTTAKVQDMCFSPDSRWVAVSTLRGTTHIFPITPYGGNVGNRTHASPHVVNRLSRFHRSAGLTDEGRSNSPISASENSLTPSNLPFVNPRLAPYPVPTVISPLQQIRLAPYFPSSNNSQPRSHSNRPRLNSTSEKNVQNTALRLCACFAPSRAYFDNINQTHNILIHKQQTKPVESLFIMSSNGTLIQYDLDPVPLSSVPKDKICDETGIELIVEPKAQWVLQRELNTSFDVPLPISADNLKHLPHDALYRDSKPNHADDQWLSQVEIVTHAGPHRRLWMGPQFSFKTYSQSLRDIQNVEIGRSQPVNMPAQHSVLIESGSISSCEQSPKLFDRFRRHVAHDVGGSGETQLKEDLADAMLESPSNRERGGRCVVVSMKTHNTRVAKVVNPLGTVVTVQSDDDAEVEVVEDAVIHENCDEALFRPVVAPKTFLFPEHKKRNPLKPTPQRGTMPELKERTKSEIEHEKRAKKEIPKIKVESKQIKISPLEHKIQIVEHEIETTKCLEATVIPPAKKTKLKVQEVTPLENVSEFHVNTLTDKEIEVDVTVPLITTPDLMDNIEVCDFHFETSEAKKASDCESIDFTPLQKIDDAIKEEKFEDACDMADVENYTAKDVKKEGKGLKFERYQGLEPDEIVFVSEDDKSSTKKPRKPKTKLGVRLSKGKDIIEKMEKENDEPGEVILAPPKKTWSSILKADHDGEDDKFLDFPPIKSPDLPIKSYSTAAKHNLFEIDPNEDLNDSCVLIPEKTTTKNNKKSEKFLKLSDDEKQENGSSQNETTESDDSATKIIAMDTEEDGCQVETTKNVQTEKNVKRKSKKKKR